MGRFRVAELSAARVAPEAIEAVRATRSHRAPLTRALADADRSLTAVDPQAEPLETVPLRPTKTNISVKLVALAWLPHWRDQADSLLPAYQ